MAMKKRNTEGSGRANRDRPTRAIKASPPKSRAPRRKAEDRLGDEERPARKSAAGTDRQARPRPTEGRSDERRSSDDRPPRKTYVDRPPREGTGRSFDKPFRAERGDSDRPTRPRRTEDGNDERRSSDERPARRPYGDKHYGADRERSFDKPSGSTDRPRRDDERSEDRPARKSYGDKPAYSKPRSGGYDRRPSKYGGKYGKNKKETGDDGTLRLNRFLSNAGIASRREADTLITAGLVTVNGQVVTELGTKVFPTDDVRFEGQRIKAEKKVYLLLNKPTKFITTTDDPRERDTVMQLIAGACRERLYPVGRLDRNTTGVLLFTNDGDMAKKLTHPSHGAKKLYHVTLNKKLAAADMKKIREGVMLQEGRAMVDDISYVEGTTTHEVGIEIHIGWNRVVRRIFEELGYEVIKLDRVMFAGLSKKKLPRGHYRFLTEKEVSILKML